MQFMDLLLWASVELESNKPDIAKVKEALRLAVQSGAALNINHEVKTNNLIRMAKVMGPDEIRGGF